MNDNFIFIDLETTGLDPRTDQICEIAAVPTDRHLEQLDAGLSVVVCPLGKRYRDLDAVVKRMHTENGLWAETQDASAVWPSEAAEQILHYLAQFGQKGEIPMAGSSIGFDRRFLCEQMPTVDEWFHYRSIDVSSLKETWKRFFPDLGEPPRSNKAHRALGDCIDSIAELRWYRDRLAVKGGGDVLATTAD